MDCPVCDNELVVGPRAYYQTLGEHAANPNQPCRLQHTKQCKNPKCKTFQRGFWGIDGGWYPICRDGEYLTDVPNIVW